MDFYSILDFTTFSVLLSSMQSVHYISSTTLAGMILIEPFQKLHQMLLSHSGSSGVQMCKSLSVISTFVVDMF